MNWFFLSVVTALGFAFADTFTKVASDKISPLYGVVFLHCTSGLIALLLALSLPFWGVEKQNMTQSGVVFSITAGVFTFIALSSFFLMFSKGAPLGIGVTITFIMSISISVLISFLFLKEAITMKQALGMGTALLSIYLLAPKS